MISEGMCLDAINVLYRQTQTEADAAKLAAKAPVSAEAKHTVPTPRYEREMLARYSLPDVQAVTKWLDLGGYVGFTGYAGLTKMGIWLTDKGIAAAISGHLSPDELRYVYQDDPYAAFVARQFRPEDEPLYAYLRDEILQPRGMIALDGRADGVEAFRGEILQKIRKARYFVCILSHRAQLATKRFASSVWLYQEIGAAVALGKKPLLLVEDGIDDHYAGELQKNYEYAVFSRANFAGPFAEIGRRIDADMKEKGVLTHPKAREN